MRLAGRGIRHEFRVAVVGGEQRDAAALLERVSASTRAGSRLLIVEPIARGVTAWWPEWTARLVASGARADEWRFRANLPPLTRQIAKGAGLDPRELLARTIAKL